MKRFLGPLAVAAFLIGFAEIRTDGFCPWNIETVGPSSYAAPVTDQIRKIVSQPFRYLGKGRQCFVFQSADERFVIKFFNRKYLQMPWYSFLTGEKEAIKRSRRRHFYEHSYEIALQEFGEQILEVHKTSSRDLPLIRLQHRTGRDFWIDLNQTAFVLQRKGDPLYLGLERIWQERGVEGLCMEIDSFLDAIELRIAKKIADADCDIEHNWGYCEGGLFHLDPGRLYYDPHLTEPTRLAREWRNGTHELHEWLLRRCPKAARYLQEQVDKKQTGPIVPESMGPG